MIKWLKPKNDFVFKLIFGSDDEVSKELLIAFLNDVLAVPEGQSLAGVEILNPTINKQYLSDKLAVLDIKAKVKGYGIINIEIQLTNQKNMHKRSLYYTIRKHILLDDSIRKDIEFHYFGEIRVFLTLPK